MDYNVKRACLSWSNVENHMFGAEWPVSLSYLDWPDRATTRCISRGFNEATRQVTTEYLGGLTCIDLTPLQSTDRLAFLRKVRGWFGYINAFAPADCKVLKLRVTQLPLFKLDPDCDESIQIQQSLQQKVTRVVFSPEIGHYVLDFEQNEYEAKKSLLRNINTMFGFRNPLGQQVLAEYEATRDLVDNFISTVKQYPNNTQIVSSGQELFTEILAIKSPTSAQKMLFSSPFVRDALFCAASSDTSLCQELPQIIKKLMIDDVFYRTNSPGYKIGVGNFPLSLHGEVGFYSDQVPYVKRRQVLFCIYEEFNLNSNTAAIFFKSFTSFCETLHKNRTTHHLYNQATQDNQVQKKAILVPFFEKMVTKFSQTPLNDERSKDEYLVSILLFANVIHEQCTGQGELLVALFNKFIEKGRCLSSENPLYFQVLIQFLKFEHISQHVKSSQKTIDELVCIFKAFSGHKLFIKSYLQALDNLLCSELFRKSIDSDLELRSSIINVLKENFFTDGINFLENLLLSKNFLRELVVEEELLVTIFEEFDFSGVRGETFNVAQILLRDKQVQDLIGSDKTLPMKLINIVTKTSSKLLPGQIYHILQPLLEILNCYIELDRSSTLRKSILEILLKDNDFLQWSFEVQESYIDCLRAFIILDGSQGIFSKLYLQLVQELSGFEVFKAT